MNEEWTSNISKSCDKKKLENIYLDNFMKIFMDNFIVYSDMETHLQKFKLCFQKCMEYNISSNPKICIFMVFSIVIFGFIVSKKGKLPNLKKI